MRKHLKNKLFLYCWMLGTKPEKQNQGFGNALMQATFNKAKQLNCPCYLEVQSRQSKLIHEHKGYQALDTVALPNSDATIIFMIKPIDNYNH